MSTLNRGPHGAGLGLRRALLGPLLSLANDKPDFLEIAPENWIGVGGRYGRQYRELIESYSLIFHGLSLDVGGPDPLDMKLIERIAKHMRETDCLFYSEHLTYCAAEGHLYDLLPIPFTEEAVRHVAARIRQVQDVIGQPLVLENASYYAQAHTELTEPEFITAVLEESGAMLLLDVNNVYVNSINHQYDPVQFISALPLERVRYLHMAGHYDEADDLKIDTHGTAVIEPVWELLQVVYQRLGALPTLLERDTNLPPVAELQSELARIRSMQRSAPVRPTATMQAEA